MRRGTDCGTARFLFGFAPVAFVFSFAGASAEPTFKFTDIALTPSSAVMNVSVASGDYVHHPTNTFDLFYTDETRPDGWHYVGEAPVVSETAEDTDGDEMSDFDEIAVGPFGSICGSSISLVMFLDCGPAELPSRGYATEILIVIAHSPPPWGRMEEYPSP